MWLRRDDHPELERELERRLGMALHATRCQRQQLVDDARARRRDEHLERARLLLLLDDGLRLCVEDEFVVLVLRSEAELQAVLPDVPDFDREDVRLVDFALDQQRDRRASTTFFALVAWNETDERLIL